MEGQISHLAVGILPLCRRRCCNTGGGFFYLILFVKEIPVPGMDTRVLVPRFPTETPAAFPPMLVLIPLLLIFSLNGPAFLLFLNLIAMVILLLSFVIPLHSVHISGGDNAGRQRHNGNTDK